MDFKNIFDLEIQDHVKILRQMVATSNDQSLKLYRSLFLDEIDSGNNLSDLVLFVCRYDATVSFYNQYEMYNSLLMVGSRLLVNITFQATDLFEVTYEGNLKPISIDRALEKLIKWVYTTCMSQDICWTSYQRKHSRDEFEHSLSRTHRSSTISLLSKVSSPDINISDDIKSYKITKNNTVFQYDIDGISGLLTNAAALKKTIKIEYSSTSKSRPHNKNKIIKIAVNPIKLTELFAVKIGKIMLSETESINFYIVLDSVINELNEERILFKKNKIAKMIDKYLSISMMNNSFLAHRNDFTKTDTSMTGYISGECLSQLITEVQGFIYFEVYNTKKVFSSSSGYDLILMIESIFDLKYITLDLDVCTSVHIKTYEPSSLFLSAGFIETVQSYSLMNCDSLSNYNFSSHNLKNNVTKQMYHGISKVNFYTPIVTEFMTRCLRNNRFPMISAIKSISSILGDFNAALLNREKKKIAELKDILKNIEKIKNRSLHIRLEMTIKSFNLPEYFNYISKIIIDKEVNLVKTDTLIKSLQSGIVYLLSKLNQGSFDIKNVSRMIYNEILFFEFNIRGGKNLHILPDSLRSSMESLKSRDLVNIFTPNENLEFSHEESCHMLTRLFKYSKFIVGEIGEKITEFLSVIENKRRVSEILLEELLQDILRRYGFSVSDLTGTHKNEKYHFDIHQSFDDVFTMFFSEPDNLNLCKFYQVYYQIIIREKMNITEIKAELEKVFQDKRISKFPSLNTSGHKVLRFIKYGKTLCPKDLKMKVDFLRKSIRYGTFNQEILLTKEIYVSESERLLMYHALKHDYPTCNQTLLLEDHRYPFYLYAVKARMYIMSKSVKVKVVNPDHIVILADNYLDMKKFTVLNIVKFLNKNKRFINSAEAIRLIDEIHHYSYSLEFPKFSDAYYQSLYMQQESGFDINPPRFYHRDYNDIECLMYYERFQANYDLFADQSVELEALCDLDTPDEDLQIVESQIADQIYENYITVELSKKEICLTTDSYYFSIFLINNSRNNNVFVRKIKGFCLKTGAYTLTEIDTELQKFLELGIVRSLDKKKIVLNEEYVNYISLNEKL